MCKKSAQKVLEEKMKQEEFKEILDKFVDENCTVPNCRECNELSHSVVIDGEKSLKELFERIINNRIPVISSNLEFISYDEPKAELSVWFKSRKNEEYYVYSNVSVITFSELMKAESKGKYFIANVKGNEFKKVI